MTPFVRALIVVCLNTVFASSGFAQRPLDLYFLDMSGGASTLIVTPAGESILIDTGSRDPEHRDADRIVQAARDAGLERIDHLVTTHFHLDHFGGIREVVRQIPVLRFYDKGHLPPEVEEDWFKTLYPRYREATDGKVTALKAGDDLPLKEEENGKNPPVRMHVIAAEKTVEGFGGDIDAPVDGFEIRPADRSDNARSIALMLRYGDFDFFAGGDITWNVEFHIARSTPGLGAMDLYQVQHHGLDQSNNPLLLKKLDPTVSVAMNGAYKGVQENTLRVLRDLPGFKALYQLNHNVPGGAEGNPPVEYVANPKESPGGTYVKVSVYPERHVFTVRLGPDGPVKEYALK